MSRQWWHDDQDDIIDDSGTLFPQGRRDRPRPPRTPQEEIDRALAIEADIQIAKEKRQKEFQDHVTRSVIWREYDVAQVEPPSLNGEGNPTCSLSLLLKLGWTLEPLGMGRHALIRPHYAPVEKPEIKF